MSRPRTIVAFLLAVGLAGASSYAAGWGSISGLVMTESGACVDSAMILLYDRAETCLDTAYTDVGGRFRFNAIPGAYLISAEKDNLVREFYPDEYLSKEADKILVNPGQNSGISFVLDSGGWISGTFAFEARLVDRGLVTALKIDQPQEGWCKSLVLDGPFPRQYSIEGLLPGTYRVLGRARGQGTEYFPGVTQIEDASAIEVAKDVGVSQIWFSLDPVGWGVIHGRAYDQATGEGISGISLTAYQWCDFWEDPNLTTSRTDEGGYFSMTLPAGKYFVLAVYYDLVNGIGSIALFYNGHYDPTLADVVTVGPNQELADVNFPIDLRTEDNLSISGTVLSEQTGLGLDGTVVVALDAYTGQALGSSFTTSDGEFSINDLSPGRYLLMFSGTHIIPYFYGQTERWQQAEVIMLQGHFGGVRTEAITQDYGNMGLAISGRVNGVRGPIGGARVYAMRSGETRPIASATSNASGEYSLIAGLEPGSYVVECDMFGYNAATYPEVISLDLLIRPEARGVDFVLEPVIMHVRDNPTAPARIEVSSNYPNPFNSTTAIRLVSEGPSELNLKLTLYDILGRKVGEKPIHVNPGLNTVEVTTHDFTRPACSGVYFYRIDGVSKTYRMVLLK